MTPFRFHCMLVVSVALATIATAMPTARAQPQVSRDEKHDGDTEDTPAESGGETIMVEDSAPTPEPGRATARVTRAELDRQQPRSVPEALRGLPGVYVQKTSAAQGSPFVRGRTGQQTVLLFDGIRLNNGIFRQGPNQYFATIDARSLLAIEVLRGGAATRYGSDAIGGVLNAIPLLPPAETGLTLRGEARTATADGEVGGRLALGYRPVESTALLVGFGARRVGRLEGGGAVVSAVTGEPALVPRLDEDGRTQLGTGFDELATDARVTHRLSPTTHLTGAIYDYRQFDAPRTDQCPAAFAPITECLIYDEQFQTLGYLDLRTSLGEAADTLRITPSIKRSHERRNRERPQSMVDNGGRDDITTYGLALSANTRTIGTGRGATRLTYGADSYHDQVDSKAWTVLTDIDFVDIASRGQYVAGSTYTTGGAFVQSQTAIDPLTIRGGVRLGFAAVDAPGDTATATQPVDRSFAKPVGHLGIDWQATDKLSFSATLDRSFRAPNLDDLTSRQATGPGFQLENPSLSAETATSIDLGVALALGPLSVQAWAYRATLTDAITRATREASDCPLGSVECESAWFRYQLVNLTGEAIILGGEGTAALDLAPFEARFALSYALGDGDDPQGPTPGPDGPQTARTPLSRVPPLNGAAELRWSHRRGFVSTNLYFSAAATRLAVSDRSDPRIPEGGTPGFAVVDARAGLGLGNGLFATLVFENVTDVAYRHHGSSVNGAGRGMILSLTWQRSVL